MIGCRWVEPLRHPGPIADERRTSIATASLSRPVSLAPGKRLVDALDEQLRALGASSAQVELLDGTFTRVRYCYPALVENGSAAVT